MKLISYMYSYSGDSGLCLSNREEWNTIDEYLYFDAEKWTMEKIYDTVNSLYKKYKSMGVTWTLGEVMDHIRDTFVPFVNGNEGVYLSNDHCWKGIKKENLIDDIKEHEVISWELDGKTVNFDYYK